MEDEMEDVNNKENDFLWFDRKNKRYMIEIRKIESWKGTMYVEIYDAPLDNIDSHWELKLNMLVQPGNNYDIWWEKRKDLYYKGIPQSQIEKELKKQAERVCKKLINGYLKESKFKLNIPIGIKKYIVFYLMVEMYIFKDFYFIYKNQITKELANAKEEIPHSLSARNIKWKSPWKGSTGEKYQGPEQLYYYNYPDDKKLFEYPIGAFNIN